MHRRRGPAPGGVDAEPAEGGVQLLPAPTHEARSGPQQFDGLRRRHQPGRLFRDGARDQDQPLLDEGGGLGPAVDQAPLDQGAVEAQAAGTGSAVRPAGRGPRRSPGRALLRRGLGQPPSWPGTSSRPPWWPTPSSPATSWRPSSWPLSSWRRTSWRRTSSERPPSSPWPPARRPPSAQKVGHLLGQILDAGDAERLQLTGHLVPYLAHEGLTALAALFEELVDLGPGILALELTVLHELRHQLLGPGPGHVGEGDSGIEILLECILVCHPTTLPGLLAWGYAASGR